MTLIKFQFHPVTFLLKKVNGFISRKLYPFPAFNFLSFFNLMQQFVFLIRLK